MSGTAREGVAVIGMSGRFPGAGNLDVFWANLAAGVESISRLSEQELRRAGVDPELLRDSSYVRAKGVLEDADRFDAQFFGFTPREAELTDPQQRLFLECAHEALEQAAYDPARYPGPIGIYGGAGINTYLLVNLSSHPELLDAVGPLQTSLHNKNDHLTTRAAYKLNLRGPGVTVQTACSTSLVAVCLACQSLLDYQCDMALAGGVTVSVPLKSGYLYREGGINSPDGCCRAFDARAAGTVDGNGVGVVVLKRLSDALADRDHIWAVIQGFAVNNDGAHKPGYTAPGLDSQAEVIATAHAMAGFTADTIGYVEAHGTGTPLGDPIEVSALTQAFRLSSTRRNHCALGSVKTNIGHLDAAAGVAGLLKTVLALRHRAIPPSLHFTEINPRIDLAASPFFVSSSLRPWEDGDTPRRAGVSSFGLGGTNAHVVLEEAPAAAPTGSGRPWQLLLLSARTSSALETATDQLREHLLQNPNLSLADAAYTLQVGRRVLAHRRAVLCGDVRDAVSALSQLHPDRVSSGVQAAGERPVVFMFPGQGSQYAGMAAGLYRSEKTFRDQAEACIELFAPHLGTDLRAVLWPAADRMVEAGHALDQTWMTQPALFTVEYALARQWMDWGVRPRAMIGHSVGEYVAACLAGVLSLDDAVALIAARSRLVQSLPAGEMMAVSLPAADLEDLLEDPVSLSAVNGPALCVVSGHSDAVRALEARLSGRGVICRRLHTSHAFHSAMMDPIMDAFGQRLSALRMNPPDIPYVSNVTGTWITPQDLSQGSYWARHLRQTVRFAEGIEIFLQDPDTVLLEVGPGRTLKNVARWHPARRPGQTVESSLPYRGEGKEALPSLLGALGRLWLAGVEIDWTRFHAAEPRRRVPLPTHPLERRRYWIEARPRDPAARPDTLEKKTDLAAWFYVPVWRESGDSRRTAFSAGEARRWLVLTEEGTFGQRLVERLRAAGQEVAMAVPADRFGRSADGVYRLSPGHRPDYDLLFDELRAGGGLPDAVVHLWSVTAVEVLERGFYSLLFLAQTLGRKQTGPVVLTVVSDQMQEVSGSEVLCPAKACLLGPCKVIPREYDQIACRSVDVVLPEQGGWQEGELIEQLAAEAWGNGSDRVVAYRGGRRWVQDFAPVRVEREGGSTAGLRQGGVYLVSGGLGGIGLEIARFLAREARAKLVLFGRSAPRETAAHELRRLEAMGAEVLTARSDVTDERQVAALVAQVTGRFGRIHGVIHAAGVADGGLMQLRSAESCAEVLAPKMAGAEALAAALAGVELDFFVLMSSLSSIVGRPGQVAYTAANSFLDAFARWHRQRTGSFTVAVCWGEWHRVGMARREAGLSSAGGASAAAHLSDRLDHPFLDRRVTGPAGEEVFLTDFSVDRHWVLDEHRLVGNPVIPGVAYIEMVRAALEPRTDGKVLQLHDVFFVAPLRVRDGQRREVRLILRSENGGFRFSVESDTEEGETQVYALGQAVLTNPRPPAVHDLETLIARCNVREEVFTDEEREEDLGPRWQNVKKGYVGVDETLTLLELSRDFAADFEKIQYHPSLMDRATGRAQEYLVDGVYMPVSYRSLRINGPVPRRVYSYARYRAADDPSRETLAFDTVVLDEQGTAVVEVEGFTQKRINDAGMAIRSFSFADTTRGRAEPAAAAVGSEAPEMSAEEGVEALRRILSQRIMPQVAVSVRDLHAAIDQADLVTRDRVLEETGRRVETRPGRHPRPSLETAYAAPRNARERAIAAIWKELLDYDQVGVDDNFFDLGGDSVQAIQIIARLTAAGLRVSPQLFFQHQTIASLAEAIGGEPETEMPPTIASLAEAIGGEPETEMPPAAPPAAALPPAVPETELGKLAVLLREVDEEPDLPTRELPERRSGPDFSLFYFADSNADASPDKYRLYVEGAQFADRNGFAAVWTPERHFHRNGGLYPNPSVLSAALATVTRRVHLRAGSVVLPLHHPLRVAEEWAVVDNLSHGRSGISVTSGWIPNDFAFSPERFADKRNEMFRRIVEVQKLWRGEPLPTRDGVGNDVAVRIFPQPIQPELPVWLTCSGDPEMFVKAGELGLNVLTALLTQSVEEAGEKIALYRDARARHGHDPEAGWVTMMLHTFVGEDPDRVLATVRQPLCGYLRSHVDLMQTMARSLDVRLDLRQEDWLDHLVSFAFERYYRTAALIGTPESCVPMVERMRAIGVDEIACLIDFGIDPQQVLAGLDSLLALKARCGVPG